MWRITRWSSEAGEGEVASDLGALPFRRAHAQATDFFVDEEVDLVLEEEGGALVPRDVAPRGWREDSLTPLDESAPEEADAAARALGETLGGHARVQLAAALEDTLTLEVHDVDWPPPVTPPLAKARFDGVRYFKLPAYSEDFVRCEALSWRAYVKARRPLLRSWGLGAELFEEDLVLFRFVPKSYRHTAGYLLAAELRVDRPK